MIKALLTIITVIAVILGCFLGYGYWHSSTHAQFDVWLKFKNVNSLPFHNSEIYFLDSEGRVLASGKVDEKLHYVQLIHPEIGNCYEKAKSIPPSKESRSIWKECYKHLPSWISQWVEKVSLVDLKMSNCTIKNIPVTVNKYNSAWWMWWVPLPHVFGKPYSYYSAHITVEKKCED